MRRTSYAMLLGLLAVMTGCQQGVSKEKNAGLAPKQPPAKIQPGPADGAGSGQTSSAHVDSDKAVLTTTVDLYLPPREDKNYWTILLPSISFFLNPYQGGAKVTFYLCGSMARVKDESGRVVMERNFREAEGKWNKATFTLPAGRTYEIDGSQDNNGFRLIIEERVAPSYVPRTTERLLYFHSTNDFRTPLIFARGNSFVGLTHDARRGSLMQFSSVRAYTEDDKLLDFDFKGIQEGQRQMIAFDRMPEIFYLKLETQSGQELDTSLYIRR